MDILTREFILRRSFFVQKYFDIQFSFFCSIFRENNSTEHDQDANEIDETEHKKVGGTLISISIMG